MTVITKHILKQGISGQTVVEAEAIICANCGIPNGKGTERWAAIVKKRPEGYDYIDQINMGWNGFTIEQMMAGVTLEAVTVEIEVIDDLHRI